MRHGLPRLRFALPAAIVLALLPGSALASTTHDVSVSGVEIYATSTLGVFTGTAWGGVTGTWTADVDHTVLTNCTPTCLASVITGGRFTLLTSRGSVSGYFDDPSQASAAGVADGIELTNAGSNCTDQVYTVEDGLNDIGTGVGGSGHGEFTATLTHLRKLVSFFGFSYCATYGATIGGVVSLTY